MHRGTGSWPALDEGKPSYKLVLGTSRPWGIGVGWIRMSLRQFAGSNLCSGPHLACGSDSGHDMHSLSSTLPHPQRTGTLLQHPETATQLSISVPSQTVPCAWSVLTPTHLVNPCLSFKTLSIFVKLSLIPIDWKRCCFPLNYCCLLCLRCYISWCIVFFNSLWTPGHMRRYILSSIRQRLQFIQFFFF